MKPYYLSDICIYLYRLKNLEFSAKKKLRKKDMKTKPQGLPKDARLEREIWYGNQIIGRTHWGVFLENNSMS